jgi:hypothetical protein
MKHLLPPAVGVVVSAVRDFVDALADLGKRVDEASRRLEKAAAASRQHVYHSISSKRTIPAAAADHCN